MDNFHKFVSSLSTKMDTLAMTESSEKEDIGLQNSVEIKGYEIYHTVSKSPKGGTAIQGVLQKPGPKVYAFNQKNGLFHLHE